MPDTQRYAAYFPEIFREQFRWIRDSVASLNIKYVIHLGDVVEEGEDAEWVVADEAFSMLDGIVPYLVVPGNHDLDRLAVKAGIRATTKFNAVFPPGRFKDQRWYGGNRGVTSDNSFGYFEAGGQEFLVLGLEYGPTDETLAWADSLVSNHDQKVILVTHCYMYDDDTRVGAGDRWLPARKKPGLERRRSDLGETRLKARQFCHGSFRTCERRRDRTPRFRYARRHPGHPDAIQLPVSLARRAGVVADTQVHPGRAAA